jgi:hypothetical protein
MDWLKNNAYIAGWLSPAIALIGMLIRGGGKSGEIDWARMMLFIGFLTCLAAAFTPAVGDGARFFAGSIAVLLAVFFMYQSDQDASLARDLRRKKGPDTTTAK